MISVAAVWPIRGGPNSLEDTELSGDAELKETRRGMCDSHSNVTLEWPSSLVG
jgi:hypothetical protein